MILLKLTGILKDEFFLLSRDIKHLSGLETVSDCATFKLSRGKQYTDIIVCYNSKLKVWKQLSCVGDKILFKTKKKG